MTATLVATPDPSPRPGRRLIATGVKRGVGPLVVEPFEPKPLPSDPRARRRTLALRVW
ncbi:hypothetical protein OG875_05010 [Streptomyces sp. NBC_01498]|uniref:hypothetical protein n=1 Tax=Streptomyces sp. NBC_01498 TaxID=2975870 RepID=UPI002E7B9626|nr:hypothetical protein [Streptomyces sp. NBC_01498]WTL24017.1 hypothetical protein OG875_05010 [Streptomyces sp. NBC_01498]